MIFTCPVCLVEPFISTSPYGFKRQVLCPRGRLCLGPSSFLFKDSVVPGPGGASIWIWMADEEGGLWVHGRVGPEDVGPLKVAMEDPRRASLVRSVVLQALACGVMES